MLLHWTEISNFITIRICALIWLMFNVSFFVDCAFFFYHYWDSIDDGFVKIPLQINGIVIFPDGVFPDGVLFKDFWRKQFWLKALCHILLTNIFIKIFFCNTRKHDNYQPPSISAMILFKMSTHVEISIIYTCCKFFIIFINGLIKMSVFTVLLTTTNHPNVKEHLYVSFLLDTSSVAVVSII